MEVEKKRRKHLMNRYSIDNTEIKISPKSTYQINFPNPKRSHHRHSSIDSLPNISYNQSSKI